MAFNSDAYIANLVKQGFSRADAVNSARYEAQAQASIQQQVAAANALADKALGKAPAPTSPEALRPTVTIGGAPASYQPGTSMQPSVTIGGAPAGYQSTVTPNYITGEGVPGTPSYQTPSTFNYITGTGTPATLPKVTVTPKTSPFDAASDAILANTLKSYGMEGVATTIAQIRADYPEISSENLLLLLKNDNRYNAEYNKRFAGNVKLKAAGLPTLDDSSYLKAEDEYKKIFTAYGATTLATKDYYATLIGNRMDAVDVTSRMNDAYGLLKASPWVMNAFKEYYSAITDGDVLALILDEKTQLPILTQKVQAAQIGGAALAQGLKTSLATAQDLQASGVTVAGAQAGYSTIAQGMTDYEKILEINAGKDIKTADVQAKLEASKLKKNASAIKEEQAAIGMEAARFGGSAGRLASKDRATGLI
jgi:hypothetical protein